MQPGVYGFCNESVELFALVEAAASETETFRADFGLGKGGWMDAVGLDCLPNDWNPLGDTFARGTRKRLPGADITSTTPVPL